MNRLLAVIFALVVSCGVGYGLSFDMPKCSDKDVIDEVEKEIVRQVMQELAEEDDEYLKEFMKMFLQEVDLKVFKIITHHTNKDLKMVGCEADLQMRLSESLLNKLIDSIIEYTFKSVGEDLSPQEKILAKKEIEAQRGELKEMLRAEFAGFEEGVDIMYQARRTDDGYLSVEVMGVGK